MKIFEILLDNMSDADETDYAAYADQEGFEDEDFEIFVDLEETLQ